MRQPLTIACAQPSVVAHDVDGNVSRHAEAIRRAAARVVVFPEMSLTGYVFDASPLEPDDRRLEPISLASAETGSLALVGAPVAEGRHRYIAMLAVTGTGVSVAYRKMSLASEEALWFAPGEEPAVVAVDGWRLGLAICKDTGEPGHAAATATLGMDVYAAGVLESAVDAGVPRSRARRVARDHGVWVAMASFAGPAGEGFDRGAGGSGIWRPDGSEADRVGAEIGAIARTSIG